MNTELLKLKLRNVFGDKYDLSKVNYVSSKDKVTLVCPIHGEFSSLPHNLLGNKGCPHCGHKKATSKNLSSLNDIIRKANEIHKYKYDYSLITEYKNNRIKYPIICHEKDKNGKEHGVFYQDFGHHINRKHGCPHCSGNAKRTLESFIEDARKVHGDKYDYSKSEYNGTHKPLMIICPIHGEFLQAPNDHLHGQGCPKCKGKKIWDSRGRLSVEDVKEQFKAVHGNKYDYSLFTEYKNNSTKIPIICKKHGVFYMTPNSHISAHKGCPKCGAESSGEKQRLSIEEVIKRIKDVHGDKFIIPSDFEYKNNIEKVKLICRKHGEFWQNPFNLWRGVGCPKCNKSKLENKISLILEKNCIEFEEQKKFDWLGKQELDFYLPKFNIAIECQGIQHFKPVARFGGEKMYKTQIEWDEKKKKLCEENGVNVLYFSNDTVMKQNGGSFPYDVIFSEEKLMEKIK